MQVIRDIEQGSEAWLNLRKGVFTASHAQPIASNGKGLETYVTELMADYYALQSDSYTNDDMARGNELEASARFCYEMETNQQVEEVTFCKLDEHIGCSPDGLVGEDGLVEIKCHNNKNYFLVMLDRKNVSSAYIWQMQMQMYVTGRKWCDYVAYNPNFEQHFVIYRFEADLKAFEKIKEGLKTAVELKLAIMDKINSNKSATDIANLTNKKAERISEALCG